MASAIHITPERFIASNGLLDTKNRYICAAFFPNFAFPQGVTISGQGPKNTYALNGYVYSYSGGVSFSGPSYLTMRATVDLDVADFPHTAVVSKVIVNASSGIATVTVNLDRPAITPDGCQVHYQTDGIGDNASASGVDYTAVSGTLVFNAGDTSKTFTIPITSHTRPMWVGWFQFSISDGYICRVDQSNRIGRVYINAHNQTGVSPTPGPTPVVFPQDWPGSNTPISGFSLVYVQLDTPAPAGGCSVLCSTQNGTAIAGVHYIAATQTINFAEGEFRQIFQVYNVGGTGGSVQRRFYVNVTSPVNCTIYDTQVNVDNGYPS